jgi:hypothetical protein
LYVTDIYDGLIRKIVIATGEVTTLPTTDLKASYAIWGDGANLYVSSQDLTIKKVVIATGETTTFAGFTWGAPIDGIGTAAAFGLPKSLWGDGTALYVLDWGSMLRKVTLATAEVKTLAGVGFYAPVVDGVGPTARIAAGDLWGDGFSIYLRDRTGIRTAQAVQNTPSILSISPARGPQGAAVPVTIKGSNFVRGATSVQASGITQSVTFSNVAVIDENTITALLHTGDAQPGLHWSISVTTPISTSYWVGFLIDPPG